MHTPGPWTVETVDTQVGHCHKIMPIEACLYVDHQRLPRDAQNAASVQALANATLMRLAPDMYALIESLVHIAENGPFDPSPLDENSPLMDAARDIMRNIKG